LTDVMKQNETPPAPSNHRSKGEKLFDWLVYGVLGTLVTFLLTLPIGYKIRYGGGEARMAAGLEKIGIRGNFARDVLKTTTLSHGGNLMILPIAYAEAHHTQIVDGLNKMTLDPTPVSEIQAKPKPTLGNLVAARATAWVAVFVSFFGLSKPFKSTFEAFEVDTGNLLYNKFGKPKTESGIAKMIPKEETRSFRYGRLAAQDIFATIAAGTLLYMGSHFFARKQKEKSDRKQETRDTADHAVREFSTMPQAQPTKTENPTVKLSGERVHLGRSSASSQPTVERQSVS
jgi:hypothetical protein